MTIAAPPSGALRLRERMMDLRQMEVVVAVADAGGFTAAARRLHVVQSAVSGTVRALERELGTPLDPDSYDYQQAARDARTFAALFDRFIQNLRRYLGYDLQYFAAVEPQRRLAPHIHIAIRGTIARSELRRVLAATYHQVWWPDASTVRYDGDELPVWDEAIGGYLDSATGECC